PMPRLRKFIFHGDVHFITLSVEEGIMLPANYLTEFIVMAALLRAQKHHPVVISHFLVSGTHIHMIVRVDNPEDIPGFMERFKTESAHYINRSLGRKKRTIAT
ncbi:MAG: transposase, partial [Bdellovibrionales bacterium]|nr:transposase [Bdellovibrionales bacterium]